MQFVQSWDDFQNGVTVYIEADENVAYAYLFVNQEFKSMVWLYNTSGTPDIPDWVTGINYKAPCRNSSEFVSSQQILPQEPPHDLVVITKLRDSDACQVEIGIIDHSTNSLQLLAILREDQKCGWSNNASKDSCVAKSSDSMPFSAIEMNSCWKDKPRDDKDYHVLEMTK